MKNVLLTTAAMLALASPALAMELGNGWAFDNAVTIEYSAEAKETAATYEADLNFQLNDEVSLYAFTEVDLQDVAFDGADLGVSYTPAQLTAVTLNAEVQLDNELRYDEFVMSAKLSF